MQAWNLELRTLRKSAGLTVGELARLAHMSEASVRAYELGRRHPTREHLLRLLTCLRVDVQSRSRVLVRAGYAPDIAFDRFAEPNLPVNEAIRVTQERAWPTFLINRRTEILGLSAPARALVGLPDVLVAPRERRSVLTVATRHAIATMAENWDQIVTGMVALFKAGVPDDADLGNSGPYLSSLVDELTTGDRSLMSRFVRIWNSTGPFAGRITGTAYSCTWKSGDGPIRLNCIVSCLNTELGLYLHAWIPADSLSHRRLEMLMKASAASARTNRTEPRPRSARRSRSIAASPPKRQSTPRRRKFRTAH